MMVFLVLACHRPPEPAVAEPAPPPPPAPTIHDPVVPIGEPAPEVDVSEIVRANAGQLRACYERELKLDPAVKGRVDTEWTVAGGRVVDVRVVENTTGKDELAACVSEAIARWSFPPSFEGEIAWPFLFRPAS